MGCPSDFRFADDGRIVVADSKANQIIVADEKGRALSVIGRKGLGPGEFDEPIKIAFGKDGLLVYEGGSQRLQFLTVTGVLLHGHAVVNPAGSCLYGTMGFGKSHLISKKNSADEEIGRYGTIYGKAWTEATDFGGSEKKRGIVPDFDKNKVIPLADGEENVYGVHQALPIIKKFRKSGELIWEKEIVVPEMEPIKSRWKESNKKAPANMSYWLAYWTDAQMRTNGNFLLLSAGGKEMIIYEISGQGEIVRKFKSGKADISMIRLFRSELWAYDDEEQAFYKFEIGN